MAKNDKTPEAAEAPITHADLKEAAQGAAEAAVKALMPAMGAVMRQGQAPVQAHGVGRKQLKPCGVCGQDLDTGCKGEHVKMVVFPQRYPQFGEFFPGAIINGKKYLSAGPNHQILVPKAARGEIQATVQAYEEQEAANRIGRKAKWNSGGLVEGGGGAVRPVEGNAVGAGWR